MKARLTRYSLLALLFSTAFPAVADDLFLWTGIGLIERVKLVVNDNVSGGCWTNANSVKQKIRLTLEQSGIGVESDVGILFEPKNARVTVTVSGKRVQGTCYSAYDFKVMRFAEERLGIVRIAVPADLFSRNGAASGENVNAQVLSSMTEFANEFAADVLKERRNPTTQKALEELL